jgi:hypothetical protein
MCQVSRLHCDIGVFPVRNVSLSLSLQINTDPMKSQMGYLDVVGEFSLSLPPIIQQADQLSCSIESVSQY